MTIAGTIAPLGRRRRGWWCWPAVVLVAATAGCSQAAREAEADSLRESIPLVEGQRIGGTFALRVRDVELSEGAPTGGARAGSLGSVAFVADPGRRQSAVRARVGEPAVFLATDRSLYARRMTTSSSERRPWFRVDLDRLNDLDVPSLALLRDAAGPGMVAVVSPQLLVDLLSGVLTGSLEVGTPAPDGTKELTFNVSVDKANRSLRLSEDERDEREKVLRALAITGDIHAGTATLRPDGTLRRLTITFDQTPDKQTKLALTAEMLLGPATADSEDILAVPARERTVRVPTLPSIIAAVGEQLREGAP